MIPGAQKGGVARDATCIAAILPEVGQIPARPKCGSTGSTYVDPGGGEKKSSTDLIAIPTDFGNFLSKLDIKGATSPEIHMEFFHAGRIEGRKFHKPNPTAGILPMTGEQGRTAVAPP